MPALDYSGQQRVGPSPIPQIRAPIETFGGGEAARPIDASGVADVTRQIYEQEKQKADSVALMGAGSDLTAASTKLLYDPETGALNAKGQDAFAMPEKVQQNWQGTVQAIRGTLTNDQQRMAFDRMAANHSAQINEQLTEHVAKERHQYAEDTATSFVANERNAAVSAFNDPVRGEQAIHNQVAAATDLARINGKPQAWLDEQIAHIKSQTRLGVLQQMLDAPAGQGGGDLVAQRYFAEHQADFRGADLLNAEKLTEAGSVRGESQRQAQSITATATSLGDALKQVQSIQDPRVQDATEDRVRRFYTDKANDLRQQRQDAYDKASQILERSGGDEDQIPLSVRELLSPSENDSLHQRAVTIRSPKTITNMASFTHVVTMASLNDATRQQFLDMRFDTPEARATYSEPDLKYLLALQRSVKGELSVGAQERRDEAATKKATAPDKSLMRKEETAVVRSAKATTAFDREKALLDQQAPGSSAYLSPPTRVPVTPWMLDSAAKSASYNRYLRNLGVKGLPPIPAEGQHTAAPSSNAPAARPTVPGGPIVKTPGGLNLRPTGPIDLRTPEGE